jgi:hypothetical protein
MRFFGLDLARHATAPRMAAVVGALGLLTACNPDSLVHVEPPDSIVQPGAVTTPAGAMQLYYTAVQSFNNAFDGGTRLNFVVASGLLTDEAMDWGQPTNNPLMLATQGFDIRSNNAVGFTGTSATTATAMANLYTTLHQPRTQALQARQGLQLYAPDSPPALRARLYALEGYTIIMLAELYCNGIPLTQVPLVGSSVPTAGFTTEEMFQHAITLFDSAIVIGTDSASYLNLAKVGKGRALLDLGQFADAAAAVHDVPTEFVYATEHNVSIYNGTNVIGNAPQDLQVRDHEGTNGLVWSTDPRTPVGTNPAVTGTLPIPVKYSANLDPTVASPLTPTHVADGLEARLIEAEADLANGGSNWLTILNTLRATCFGSAACAPMPGLPAAAMPALTDPGSADTRLTLLMQERAYWLYLTGHREGDLRRLAHLYHRDPDSLWPVGVYSNPAVPPFVPAGRFNGLTYGNDYVAQPSGNETMNNPLYHGCFDNLP